MVLKKFVVVVGQLTKGGLERQLLYLIRELNPKGVEITCVVWNFNEEDPYVKPYREELGDKLIGLSTGSGTIQKVKTLRALLKQSHPQLLLSFTTFVNFPAYLSALFLRIPVVGSLRTSAEYLLKQDGIKGWLGFLFPGKILVNSHRAIEEIKGNKLLSLFSRCSYFPNVLDVNQFVELANGEAPTYNSVSIGNARYAKRLDRMIEVFKILKRAGKSDIRHVHIGGGEDLEKIKKSAVEAGLSDQISFLGVREDAYNYLNRSEMFLHFSEIEGSPNVIMEAMAAGLPVISTDCGDSSRYVINGENGYLINPYSDLEYSEKLKDLIDNPGKRAKMAVRSRELISKSDIRNLPFIFKESMDKLGIHFNIEQINHE